MSRSSLHHSLNTIRSSSTHHFCLFLLLEAFSVVSSLIVRCPPMMYHIISVNEAYPFGDSSSSRINSLNSHNHFHQIKCAQHPNHIPPVCSWKICCDVFVCQPLIVLSLALYIRQEASSLLDIIISVTLNLFSNNPKPHRTHFVTAAVSIN